MYASEMPAETALEVNGAGGRGDASQGPGAAQAGGRLSATTHNSNTSSRHIRLQDEAARTHISDMHADILLGLCVPQEGVF